MRKFSALVAALALLVLSADAEACGKRGRSNHSSGGCGQASGGCSSGSCGVSQAGSYSAPSGSGCVGGSCTVSHALQQAPWRMADGVLYSPDGIAHVWNGQVYVVQQLVTGVASR